jgi:hypothetical protein
MAGEDIIANIVALKPNELTAECSRRYRQRRRQRRCEPLFWRRTAKTIETTKDQLDNGALCSPARCGPIVGMGAGGPAVTE